MGEASPMIYFNQRKRTMNPDCIEAAYTWKPPAAGICIAASDQVRVPRGKWMEPVFASLTKLSAIAVLGLLGGIFALLFYESLPAFHKFGVRFLFSDAWNPVLENFGALSPICGTLISSFIAMLVGTPLAFGVALFLNELCPFRIRPVLGVAVELLAAIPSIIYGMWGLFVLAPFMSRYVEPGMISLLGPIPVIGSLFQGPPFGIGMLTAGLILAVMILPFIAAVSRQVFATAPPLLREAAYGVGANTWEVCIRILIPYARTELLGAVMLGLGRALGETMAVTFVIGNAHHISQSLLAPGTTISAVLANEFTEAIGGVYISSLLALGFILFLITFSVLFLARLLMRRADHKAPL